MPKGQLKINGKDAYTEYGVSFDDTALSALMTPASLKENIENDSRLEHGKRQVKDTDPKKDTRDLTLQLNITATGSEQFFERYAKFCAVLDKRWLDIETIFQKGVVYHVKYISCSQFSEYNGTIGKFVLKVNEYNPNERS